MTRAAAMEEAIVSVENGKLQGKISSDFNGRQYYSFQGIPYAKPPVGNLRFKAPLPADSWKGVRDATKDGNDCVGRNKRWSTLMGSEDCLYLNVYTPQLPSNLTDVRKPVMVWIHGGAFCSGSGKYEFHGPEFLLTEDVVIVTLNYRLGALGFLSLNDASLGVPGNAGLKDMILALKWVQTNISKFTGDPMNVTIFGTSAGGASVHCLMLSTLAEGLFHRVISQSGTAVNSWAEGKRCATDLVKLMGVEETNESKILHFLQEASLDKIFLAQEQLTRAYSTEVILPFAPVIELLSSEPAVFTKNPLQIIASGKYNKVPLMIGYTSREGMIYGPFIPTNFEGYVPNILNLDSKSLNEAANKIKAFYYGCEEPTLENIDKYYTLRTDNLFLTAIFSTVRNHLQSSTTPVYFYRFDLDSSLSYRKIERHILEPGVCHSDEVEYLFKSYRTPSIQSKSTEHTGIRRVVKLWTTFARYGNPNPITKDPLINVVWQPATVDALYYLNITDCLTVGENPEKERMEFWDQIYKLNPSVATFFLNCGKSI